MIAHISVGENSYVFWLHEGWAEVMKIERGRSYSWMRSSPLLFELPEEAKEVLRAAAPALRLRALSLPYYELSILRRWLDEAENSNT